MHTLLGEETHFLEAWFRNMLFGGALEAFSPFVIPKKELDSGRRSYTIFPAKMNSKLGIF